MGDFERDLERKKENEGEICFPHIFPFPFPNALPNCSTKHSVRLLVYFSFGGFVFVILELKLKPMKIWEPPLFMYSLGESCFHWASLVFISKTLKTHTSDTWFTEVLGE